MIRSQIYVPSIGARLFFCWLATFSRMIVLSYGILFSYVLLLPLRSLLFSYEAQKGSESRREEEAGRNRKGRGRGNCIQGKNLHLIKEKYKKIYPHYF